jgi:ATP adenylyltransferase
MSQEVCPFCSLEDSERVFHSDGLVSVLWDGFPVSPGHALVVPRRHVVGWFDATPEEQAALIRGLDVARAEIIERYQPDGFNVGINVGEAAGQTVFHLHVHLIPRYKGDVEDPRGGIRHVVPARSRYWEEP